MFKLWHRGRGHVRQLFVPQFHGDLIGCGNDMSKTASGATRVYNRFESWRHEEEFNVQRFPVRSWRMVEEKRESNYLFSEIRDGPGTGGKAIKWGTGWVCFRVWFSLPWTYSFSGMNLTSGCHSWRARNGAQECLYGRQLIDSFFSPTIYSLNFLHFNIATRQVHFARCGPSIGAWFVMYVPWHFLGNITFNCSEPIHKLIINIWFSSVLHVYLAEDNGCSFQRFERGWGRNIRNHDNH